MLIKNFVFPLVILWVIATAILKFYSLTLSELNEYFEVATPLVLLSWFYYYQHNLLKTEFLKEIPGVYAGFVDPLDAKKGSNVDAGIIMSITKIDNNGNFVGELNHGENMKKVAESFMSFNQVREGTHLISGKLDFKLHWLKERKPFDPNDNRKYIGKIYFVDRFDFDIETQNIETFKRRVYTVTYYREMKLFKFVYEKLMNEDLAPLPNNFLLNGSHGVSFEPTSFVKDVAFSGNKNLRIER